MDTDNSLDAYTMTTLVYSEEEGVKCGTSGVAVRNYDDTSDKREGDSIDNNGYHNDIMNAKSETSNIKITGDAVNDVSQEYSDALNIDYRRDYRPQVNNNIIDHESEDIYNMMSEVKEEVLATPQHLKKETKEETVKDIASYKSKDTNGNRNQTTKAITISAPDTEEGE